MTAENQPDSQPKLSDAISALPAGMQLGEGLYEINKAWRTATHVMAGDELLSPVPRLSILLATVQSRAELFALLHAELLRQSEGRSAELVIACDNKEISIGKKRQNLLEAAKGEYVCFIDDDDWISPYYVTDILAALAAKPDCIGFEIQCTHNGHNPQRAIASMRYKQWCDNRDGYRFCRSIYHKTPVRRELALQAGFPDLRYGEDKIYSERIMGLVKTEVFIKSTLYFYRFSSHENFATKYGFPKTYKKGVDPTHVRRKFHT